MLYWFSQGVNINIIDYIYINHQYQLLISIMLIFIHFLFILIKKVINVYMLTCSEAAPQRCSNEQVLRKMRGKPTGEHPCRSMISMEN